jgi:hypothetical protein
VGGGNGPEAAGVSSAGRHAVWARCHVNRGGPGSLTSGPHATVTSGGVEFEFKQNQMKFKSFQTLTSPKRILSSLKKLK